MVIPHDAVALPDASRALRIRPGRCSRDCNPADKRYECSEMDAHSVSSVAALCCGPGMNGSKSWCRDKKNPGELRSLNFATVPAPFVPPTYILGPDGRDETNIAAGSAFRRNGPGRIRAG